MSYLKKVLGEKNDKLQGWKIDLMKKSELYRQVAQTGEQKDDVIIFSRRSVYLVYRIRYTSALSIVLQRYGEKPKAEGIDIYGASQMALVVKNPPSNTGDIRDV